MDSTAAVKFLGSIGIYDFPIFSLLTEGSVGIATCTGLRKLEDQEEGHDGFPQTEVWLTF